MIYRATCCNLGIVKDVAETELTDFGNQRVTPAEKTARVGAVFSEVASDYDLMNDLMSLGTHRFLKRMLVHMSAVRSDHKVLDLAGGSGDISLLFAKHIGAEGEIVLADINGDMLLRARDRLLDHGVTKVNLVTADASALPMEDNTFDRVVVAFGLRNFTHKERALNEIHRTLNPGGRLLVMEFSRPDNDFLAGAFNAYMSLWPHLGRLIHGQSQPYRYLVESIHKFPSPQTVSLMFADAGFDNLAQHSFLGGAVMLHIGRKPEDS